MTDDHRYLASDEEGARYEAGLRDQYGTFAEQVDCLARLLYTCDGGLPGIRRQDRDSWVHPADCAKGRSVARYRSNAEIILRDYQPRRSVADEGAGEPG